MATGPLPWRRSPRITETPREWLTSALYAFMDLLMRGIVRAYFRRLVPLHRHRFPSRGPALVVANHPAAWTDVLVLDVALGRKLHFLARDTSFRPWLRAVLLDVYGALPVRPRAPGGPARNEETFRRCHELFDQGEAVAIFPEGVSAEDRSIRSLKTGAARIALEYLPRSERAQPLQVLPVGLHYVDRTRWRYEVAIAVGEPVELEPFRRQHAVDPEAAVHRLTQVLRAALGGLVVDLAHPEDGELVSFLTATYEPIRDAAAHLERARHIGARVENLRERDRDAFRELRLGARRLRKRLRAMRIGPGLLWEASRGRPALARPLHWLRIVALAPLALLGLALHAIPLALTDLISRKVAPQPTRIGFARVAFGLVLFPAAYASMVYAMAASGWGGRWIALGLFVSVLLAGLATAYRSWYADFAARFRLGWVRRAQPRFLDRALGERARLLEGIESGQFSHGAVRAG